jgi:hypothetical protein
LLSGGRRPPRSCVQRVEPLGQHDDGFDPPSGFSSLLPRPSRCVLSDGGAGVGAFLTGLAGPGGKMDEAGATRRSGNVSNLAHDAEIGHAKAELICETYDDWFDCLLHCVCKTSAIGVVQKRADIARRQACVRSLPEDFSLSVRFYAYEPFQTQARIALLSHHCNRDAS